MLFFMLDSKPDSLTIGPTIKQNMRIHRRMHPKKIKSIKFKMADFRQLYILTSVT